MILKICTPIGAVMLRHIGFGVYTLWKKHHYGDSTIMRVSIPNNLENCQPWWWINATMILVRTNIIVVIHKTTTLFLERLFSRLTVRHLLQGILGLGREMFRNRILLFFA